MLVIATDPGKRGLMRKARSRERWTLSARIGLGRTSFRTLCGLLGHGESPLARAASNSVRATCSAFLVAAAPTGFAS